MGVTMACEETISKVVLTVDDTEHPYICSADLSRQIHWPGKADKRRALLDAYGTNGRHDHISRDGEFGLFRLLEAGAPGAAPAKDPSPCLRLQALQSRHSRDGRRTRPIPRR
jgi:type VI protein secretion system component VasK